MEKVEFKVAMNQEEKEAGNIHEVKVQVDMNVDMETLRKYALRAYKVELQGQIRPNWDKFASGDYPKELKLGESMFESKRGVVTVVLVVLAVHAMLYVCYVILGKSPQAGRVGVPRVSVMITCTCTTSYGDNGT